MIHLAFITALTTRIDYLQRRMKQAGMTDEASYDHCTMHLNPALDPRITVPLTVLTADYAALLAEEFGRNPVISDEAAFDIYPLFVTSFISDVIH